MKKCIVGCVVIKLVLFSVFIAHLAGCSEIQLAQTYQSPTPTPDRTVDKIDRPTSNPYKGDLFQPESKYLEVISKYLLKQRI